MARNNCSYLPFEKVDKEVGQSILKRRVIEHQFPKVSLEITRGDGILLWPLDEQRDILQVLQIVHINFSVYDTELHAALPATATIH